jgi:competence protein ComFC
MVCKTHLKDYSLLVCPSCLKNLPYNKKYCRVCAVPLDTVYGDDICINCKGKRKPVTGSIAPFIYKDDIRKAVIALKFHRKNYLADTFASFIFMEMKRQNIEGDIISFVPIHFIRKGMRGYNQSELIAKSLSKITGLPVLSLIRKAKNTKPLSRMKFKERKEAVKNVYSPKKRVKLRGERIILVDDVITTGSTVGECTKILKKMGAGKVFACAFAATAVNN